MFLLDQAGSVKIIRNLVMYARLYFETLPFKLKLSIVSKLIDPISNIKMHVPSIAALDDQYSLSMEDDHPLTTNEEAESQESCIDDQHQSINTTGIHGRDQHNTTQVLTKMIQMRNGSIRLLRETMPIKSEFTRSQGYKNIMLSSAEHEILNAH